MAMENVTQVKYTDIENTAAECPLQPTTSAAAVPRTYKRRWFGVAIVALLNFMTAFSIIIYAPVADLTRQYFRLSSLTPVNWIYISAMFVYVVVSPISIFVTKRGTRLALVTGAALLILGSWLRYIGARTNSFACVIVGSILCGASQPFALNIATHYTNIWFAQGGRLTATALMSLSNPLGQAVSSLVVPFMATNVAELPNMTLYVAILFTGTSCLTVFTPVRPPTPILEVRNKVDLRETLRGMSKNVNFLCILVAVSIYIGLFNALATLLEQITSPYGFSDIDAGILGAVLVVFGLIASAAVAPILDRTRAYKVPLSLAVTAIILSYFAIIFMIRQYTLSVFIGVLVFVALIGASSLITLPLILELAADVTFPAAPEFSSSIMWMGGQLLSGIIIVIMDALRQGNGLYTHSLIFMVVIATIPLPFVVKFLQSRDVQVCRDRRNGIDNGEVTS